MIHRILFNIILLVTAVLAFYGTTSAQGGRVVRYWIECDGDGEARIFVYVDNAPWPYPPPFNEQAGVWISSGGSGLGEGPMQTWDIQPKYVAPHKRGANSVDYRVTVRFGDGGQEVVYLHYGWPNACNPTSPQYTQPQQPTQPPLPTIDYPATQRAIDNQNATAAAQAAQNATAQALAAEAARRATQQAVEIQNAEATRRAIEAEAAAAARRATEQWIQIQNANATVTANAFNTRAAQSNETATTLAQNQLNAEQTATAQTILLQQNFETGTAQAHENETASARTNSDATKIAQDFSNATATAAAILNTNITVLPISPTPISITATPPAVTATPAPGETPLPPGGAGFLDGTSGWLILLFLLLLLIIATIVIIWYTRRSQQLRGQTKPMPPTVVPYVGNYEIVQPLDAGGQGTLFLARHRTLGNYVALKQDDSGDPTQFQYEAQLLASLSHPNLPRVTDFFIDASGKLCLVMDYIQGENLEKMVQQNGVLPEATALALLRPIFEAVKYLHANRVIHRDIKPANIIITPHGNAVLVDFGIAKTMATGQLTRTGARGMGTAGYAPPEQYSGGTREQSDVYALGATLYYILTAHVPVESTHRAAGSDLAAPRQVNPNITPRTEAAIVTAMNLAMNQRFASVTLMEQALY